MCFCAIICVFVLLCVCLCLVSFQFNSIPISSSKSLSGRLYAHGCVNITSSMQRTLRNSEIGLTYLK
uniref:Secreted protein n=1 Tax=Helianthus annuus TaxID=4232 RepID=A0A251VFF8_HELAN